MTTQRPFAARQNNKNKTAAKTKSNGQHIRLSSTEHSSYPSGGDVWQCKDGDVQKNNLSIKRGTWHFSSLGRVRTDIKNTVFQDLRRPKISTVFRVSKQQVFKACKLPKQIPRNFEIWCNFGLTYSWALKIKWLNLRSQKTPEKCQIK